MTDVWNSNGVTEEVEYAILTNEIYKTWSGMTAREYKDFKGLKKEPQNVILFKTSLYIIFKVIPMYPNTTAITNDIK